MDSIGISKFKEHCLRILAEISKGAEPLEVTKNGEPLVIIYPANRNGKNLNLFGCMEGTGEILGDLIEPVPIEEQGWKVLK